MNSLEIKVDYITTKLYIPSQIITCLPCRKNFKCNSNVLISDKNINKINQFDPMFEDNGGKLKVLKRLKVPLKVLLHDC